MHVRRAENCAEADPDCLHVTRYAGVDADAVLEVVELEQTSPLLQCCGWLGACAARSAEACE